MVRTATLLLLGLSLLDQAQRETAAATAGIIILSNDEIFQRIRVTPIQKCTVWVENSQYFLWQQQDPNSES